VDALLFEERVVAAMRADPDTRAAALHSALAIYRGPLLGDDEPDSPLQPESARLAELRVRALEELFDAELSSGRRVDPSEIEALLAEHPYRERLWSSLARAMYREGRQADALAAVRRARHQLVEELGIEPGDELTSSAPPGANMSRARAGCRSGTSTQPACRGR
jgi:DNA-binding SARP family transcriptional activator